MTGTRNGMARRKNGAEMHGDSTPGSLLLDINIRVPIEGQISKALRSAMTEKGSSTDAISLKGIFDRWELAASYDGIQLVSWMVLQSSCSC